MDKEKREKRAKSMSAMGLVVKEGDGFKVSTPSLRGNQKSYIVRRNEAGEVVCNCLEFADEREGKGDKSFRCEHILAVKYALVEKTVKDAPEPEKAAETAPDAQETASEQAPEVVKNTVPPEHLAVLTITQTRDDAIHSFHFDWNRDFFDRFETKNDLALYLSNLLRAYFKTESEMFQEFGVEKFDGKD